MFSSARLGRGGLRSSQGGLSPPKPPLDAGPGEALWQVLGEALWLLHSEALRQFLGEALRLLYSEALRLQNGTTALLLTGDVTVQLLCCGCCINTSLHSFKICIILTKKNICILNNNYYSDTNLALTLSQDKFISPSHLFQKNYCDRSGVQMGNYVCNPLI